MPGIRVLPPDHGRVGPFIRLAAGSGNEADNILCGRRGVTRISQRRAPPLLCSYAFRKTWHRLQGEAVYYDWVLDSGAFSAHNAGKPVKIREYIDYCKKLMDHDTTLVEIYALDVIGDWRATQKNTDAMWGAGIAAIPTYHYSEPEDVLRGLARDYPKIAIGGMSTVKGRNKIRFAEQCFTRIWPCAVHGFAVSDESSVMAVPWSSVDSTTWVLGPARYGNWKSFGGTKAHAGPRGGKKNLLPEIDWYMKLQKRAEFKWQSELSALPYRTGRLAV